MPPLHPEAPPFASLMALRAAHMELMRRFQAEPQAPELAVDAQAFLASGAATGAIIAEETDRWSAQSLLDYWSTVLYRAGQPAVDATLAEFDPARAPELPNEACPFRGLDVFREEDAARFFGRKRVVGELLQALRDKRLLAVLGPSGSGKSSLVRAGLVPALKAGGCPGSEQWHYLPPIVPGSEPLAALERALGSVGGTAPRLTVLVVDQFEEVFTLCTNEDARAAFLERLITLVADPEQAARLVLTMRSDFEPFVTRAETFLPLFEASKVVLPPLSAAELREAIERPSEQVGLVFEHGVVDALLRDILGEPAALPLLQFTLLQLWERRDRNRVTLEAYQKTGGGRLALARAADSFYERLIPENRTTAKRILLSMVRPTQGLEVTSSRVRRRDVNRGGEDPGRVERVLAKLVAARLVRVTPGESQEDDQVEVAHEALIRNWPTLVNWLDEERTALRNRQRIADAAQLWDVRGRDNSVLLRGGLLIEAEEAREASGLNELERAFLAASRSAEDEERLRELEQVRKLARERARSVRRLRWSVAFLAIGLMLAILGAAVAIREQRSASLSAQIAQTSEAEAVTRRLAAAALSLERGSETGLLLAYEAAARSDDPGTSQTLRQLIDQRSWVPTALAVPGRAADGIRATVSTDGERVAVGHKDGAITLWDGAGLLLATFHPHGASVEDLYFSEDGSLLASFARDQTAHVLNVASGTTTFTVDDHRSSIVRLDFSSDGRRLLTASEDGVLFVWDSRTGQRLFSHSGIGGSLTDASFDPGGGRVVTTTRAGGVQIWEISSDKVTDLVHPGMVREAAFSPDGRRIVTACDDGIARVWDLDGRNVATLRGHRDVIYTVGYSPDGQAIVTASLDRTARLWSAAGEPLAVLRGHADRIYSASFTPDSQFILTGSRDGSARLWDRTGTQVALLDGPTASLFRSRVSKNFAHIVTSGDDGVPRIWSRARPPLPPLLGHTDAVLGGAYSPDSRTIVTASADHTARLWDAASGELRAILEGHTDAVHSSAFSPDGQKIITASADGTARLWDAATGRPELVLVGHAGPVYGATFDPSGQSILTFSGDSTARLWSAAGESVAALAHGGPVQTAVFSGDGGWLATASVDGTAHLWDASGKPLAILNHRDFDPRMQVHAVAISPDSQLIVTGAGFQSVSQGQTQAVGIARMWDRTGRLLATLQGHTDEVVAVAFDPGGRFFITASRDRSIRRWDLRGNTAQAVAVAEEHRAEIYSVAISRDSEFAVTASRDGSAVLWRGGRVVARFAEGDGRAQQAVFSPDSRRVLVVLSDGTGRQYLTRTDDLLGVVSCRVGRGLTQAEQELYQIKGSPAFDFTARRCPS